MRGEKSGQSMLLTLVTPNQMVPPRHPIRTVKKLADECLAELSSKFDEMYAPTGRPSIPPERLLKAQLLMALFSVRSERMLCERIQYDMLFRWFLDMSLDEDVFDQSSFSRNRDRLLEHEVAHLFLQKVVKRARREALMSGEHFSVDGTLMEAWASMKSFQPKKDEKNDDDDGPKGGDSNGWADFKGTTRSNDTHESKTDPEAKLRRKGQGMEAKLCFAEHLLMENRNGLIVDVMVTPSVGHPEPMVALEMMERSLPTGRITVAADKGYDTKDFVSRCRELGITPHVAKNEHARRSSNLDDRTTRFAGYQWSQVVRRRIESIFGWKKTVGGCRKSRYRGVARSGLFATFAAAAYNLLRMSKLLPA